MPPRIVLRVVNRAALPPAHGAGERAAARKIHIQIEPTGLNVERAARHCPRRRKPQGKLKKVGVSHPDTIIANPPPSFKSPAKNRTYPLVLARSPKFALQDDVAKSLFRGFLFDSRQGLS